MTVKITKPYRDKLLNRNVSVGEDIGEVTEERAEQLIAAGVAEATEYGYKPRKSKHTFEGDVDA